MTSFTFLNSEGNVQNVAEDPCPSCGYPERHRVWADATLELIADGCPRCETSRMPVNDTHETRG